MVEFRISKTKIRINFLFVAMLSLLSLWDKSGCVFLSVLFSLLHETGHIIAVALCKEKIEELCFQPFGIAMKLSKSTSFSTAQEIFVLFAGCAVNILCAVLLRTHEICLYINAGIFLFNILPVGNLDGGRIVKLFITRLAGEKRGNVISNIASFAFLLPISAVAFYITIKTGRFSLLVCCIYLALTTVIKREKLI